MAGNLELRNFYYMAELTEIFNYWTFTLSHASFKDSPLNLKHFHAKVNFPVYHFSLFYNENCLINVPPWVTGKKKRTFHYSKVRRRRRNQITRHFRMLPLFFVLNYHSTVSSTLNCFRVLFSLLVGILYAKTTNEINTHTTRKKSGTTNGNGNSIAILRFVTNNNINHNSPR